MARIPLKNRDVYKVGECAVRAGIGVKAMRALIKKGKCPSLKIDGRNVIVPKAAFHQWLDSCGSAA